MITLLNYHALIKRHVGFNFMLNKIHNTQDKSVAISPLSLTEVSHTFTISLSLSLIHPLTSTHAHLNFPSFLSVIYYDNYVSE